MRTRGSARRLDNEQHQKGPQGGNDAGQNKRAVELAGMLHDKSGDDGPGYPRQAADQMDKTADAAYAGFMHHVLDYRPINGASDIEEKDRHRHQYYRRDDARYGARQRDADGGGQ